MKFLIIKNKKGITLIELLIALVILGMTIAGIYRLFIAQTKAYTVQDQVIEVQQNIRSVMEILLRDLRMAGFDDDSPNSNITVANPIIVGDESITVNYEYDPTTLYTVSYWRDANSQKLYRQLIITKDDGSQITGNQECILENVDRLSFRYGVDGNDDKSIDDINGDGVINDDDWVSSNTVTSQNLKVLAVRVVLSAKPQAQETNQDVKVISPRMMTSAVTLRNLCM